VPEGDVTKYFPSAPSPQFAQTILHVNVEVFAHGSPARVPHRQVTSDGYSSRTSTEKLHFE